MWLRLLSTRARFGLAGTDATDNSRILIIEAEEQVIGILADSEIESSLFCVASE